MTGETIGWVILGVFFALPLVYLVIHFTWGKKYVMPPGTKLEADYEGYKVTFIYGDGADNYFSYPPKTIASACALAAWSIGSRWDEKRNGRGRGVPKHVVVHVLDDEDYHKTYDAPWASYGVKSNGMLQSVNRRLGGDSLPLVACRARAFPSTPLTGSLVVHELTHFVGGDREHTDKAFWNPNDDSLEKEAQRRHIAHREQIGIKV